MQIFYKIRRKSDGKFSLGGTFPLFNTIGKSWSKAALGSHLTLVDQANFYGHKLEHRTVESVYEDCEIVECAISEVSTVPVVDYNETRKREAKVKK